MEKNQSDPRTLIAMTSNELATMKQLANNYLIIPGEDNSKKTITYPYAATIGAVTVTGILYVKSPADNSWTEGVVVGVVNGSYKLDKKGADVNLYGLWSKVNVEINFANREAKATLYSQDILSGKWYKKGWAKLGSW